MLAASPIATTPLGVAGLQTPISVGAIGGTLVLVPQRVNTVVVMAQAQEVTIIAVPPSARIVEVPARTTLRVT